jgi:hypothetical protein
MTNSIGDALTAFAIFGSGFGFWAYWLRLKSQQKMMEMQMKMSRGEPLSENKDVEITRLREEVARLRETTTQYDISIQHALEETQHRLAALETKTRVVSVPETPSVQRNGLGD